MPPSELGYSAYHDGDYAGGPPGDPAPEPPRFARSVLDPAGQKIYDQLKAQRAYLEQSMGPEQAAKYYTTIGGLDADSSIAMMAEQIRGRGITDIYKVKQETQRIPVEMHQYESSEGGANYITYFTDLSGQEVPGQNVVKGDHKNGFYVDRLTYLNTETGQPITPAGRASEWGERPDLLSDTGIAKRQIAGVGVKFLDDGTPFYFSEGLKVPSGGFFRSGIGSALLGLGASFLLGPQMAGLSKIAASSIGGGLAGLARSDGDLKEALKGAALSGLTSYGLEQLMAPSFNTPSPDDFAAMEAAGYQAGNIDDLFSGSGATLPDVAFPEIFAPSTLPTGEAGIQQIIAEAAGAPTPELGADYYPEGSVPPDMLPEAPKLPEIPTTSPEWDTGYPPAPQVPEGSLGMDPTLGDPTAAPGGMPTEATPKPEFDITDVVPPDADPTLGDPTAAPGGMPKLSVGDQLAIAGMTAGGTLAEFAATRLGRLAMTIGGSALVNKLFNEQQAGGAGTGTQGWSGEIPKYQMVRERVPLADAGRRPGEYGRRYFSDASFVPITPGAENAEANLGLIQQAQQAAQAQATGLASLPPGIAERRAMPAPTVKYQTAPTQPTTPSAGLPTIPTYVQEPRLSYGLPTPDERLEATNFRAPEERRLGLARGGLASLAKGRYLDGPTDGMEDKLKTTIEGEQPARLSHGEFVIPADVVSHLGNGNSQAGAKRLYDMMDKIRHARTGTKKQGKQINPDKYLPS